MNRTLSEIDALIEAEVRARMEVRMKAFAEKLRDVLSEVDGTWHYGARPDQMTDGIEITPPASSVEKAQAEGKTIGRAVVEVKLAPESLKSLEAHIDQVVAEAQLETETADTDAPARTARDEGVDAFVAAAKGMERAFTSLSEAARQVPVKAQAPAPEEAEPAAVPAVENKPEWYVAATKAAKSPKLRQIIDQLATDGDITLNGVIYAFRPPIKETYALNFVSDVRRCLKAAGWDLVRGNDGAYRAQVAQ